MIRLLLSDRLHGCNEWYLFGKLLNFLTFFFFFFSVCVGRDEWVTGWVHTSLLSCVCNWPIRGQVTSLSEVGFLLKKEKKKKKKALIHYQVLSYGKTYSC